MDVLELPRPVINFLRTMAKESCRYALSWDIFGGPDSVTLTLTWKLIDDEAQSSMINETMSSPPSSSSSLKQQQQQQQQQQPQQQNYDNPRTRSTIKDSNRPSSPRRSRRDENTSINENISVPAIFRSSRGKSLEGSSLQSNKQIISHHQHNVKEQQQPQQHVLSLERQTITNHHHQHQHQHRTKKEQQKQIPIQSDQIYGNLYDTRSTPVVKCATISSLSSSSPSPQPNNINNNNNPPLSFAHTHHQRAKQQPVTPPTTRKPIRSLLMNTSRTPTIPITSNISSNYTKSRGNNNITTHNDNNNNDDDDDTLDPWVKRFECSFEDNDDETTEQSEEKEPTSTTTDNIDELGNTSGKVKFKTKPDYF
ncbi:unnamed protein product [Rotaria sordida]|uniref:Uncharacterized protein n=1 Tax=Rotaria sordida TaxID=392033 RepID=A0A818LQR5_9BILA|nr:unnamed protein product [Rotaria sordida]CAF3578556.1 unnamed protein product [Rotaria sordida]CAF3581576.1 unnamed protein product [Rotaria sordida]